jgi:hypothetical protein
MDNDRLQRRSPANAPEEPAKAEGGESPARQFQLPAGYVDHYGLNAPIQMAARGESRQHEGQVASDGAGEPLPSGLQHSMERSFASDFSSVRVHQGPQADALGAAAYTQGSEIHFSPGQYDPHSEPGRQLIGHELTHVVQQRGGQVSAPQGKDAPVNADPALEAQADQLGAQAARGEAALLPPTAAADAGGRALQLTKFKGSGSDKSLSKCFGQLVVITVAKKDLQKEDRLKVAVTHTQIGEALKKKLVLDKVPQFTFLGAMNTLGDHEINFGKTDTIHVRIELEGSAREEKEQKDKQQRDSLIFDAGKKAPIDEPKPTMKEAPLTSLFGTEFTFTNTKMFEEAKAAVRGGSQQVQTKENRLVMDQWAALIDAGKPEGLEFIERTVVKGCPAYKVVYKDGWWFQLSLDVACIETQTFKMSLEDAQARGWLVRLDRDLFGLAAKLGLHADKLTGGGHIHLDLTSTFGGNHLLFRNFLVDFCNNPFAIEALENDPENTPVVAQLLRDHRETLATILKQFDKQKALTGLEAIKWLADHIAKKVYLVAFNHLPEELQLDPPEKYHALNVDRIVGNKDPSLMTLEVRALRAQRSVAEFVKIAQLLQARVQLLKSKLSEGPIAFNPELQREKDHSEAVVVCDAFKVYVEQCKLAWNDYKELAVLNLDERAEERAEQKKAREKKQVKSEPKIGREGDSPPSSSGGNNATI